jgi:hypothetical protein
VITEAGVRLSVTKQETHVKYGKINLKTINKIKLGRVYQVKISNTFASLENLDNSKDVNRARGNIIISRSQIKRGSVHTNRS